MLRLVVAISTSFVCMAIACADQPPVAAADDTLAGPKVADRPKPAATLIERSPTGELKRLERDPALEAVDKLELDAETKAKVDDVVIKRLAVLDTIVQDNVLLLSSLENAKKAGDKVETKALLGVLLEKAKPFFERGSLADELKPVLSDEQHVRLTKLIDEYAQAAIAERMKSVGEDGKPTTRTQAAITERLTQFGIEVRRAYERRVQPGGKELDELLKALFLSPEQEAKVRTRITDAYIAAQGRPSRQIINQIFVDIWPELTSEQRTRLADILRQRRLNEQSASGK